MPDATEVKETLPAAVALTVRFNAFGSFEQSGKALLLAVRHTSTLPFLLRRPDTDRSSELSAAAFAATVVVKMAKTPIAETQVSAADFIPKPEI